MTTYEDPTTSNGGPGLNAHEHHAMDLTVQLWQALHDHVVGHGPTRRQDLAELGIYLHALQHAILAQAAGRAHPDRYRTLGG